MTPVSNDLSLAAIEEVRVLHVMIEDWFNARLPATALDTLLARFSEDFSMVGIAGQRLDRNALQGMFAGGHGAQAGLVITLEAVELVSAPAPLAMVRYREGHQRGVGPLQWRESLAVLRQDAGGLRWLALHEVAVPPNRAGWRGVGAGTPWPPRGRAIGHMPFGVGGE